MKCATLSAKHRITVRAHRRRGERLAYALSESWGQSRLASLAWYSPRFRLRPGLSSVCACLLLFAASLAWTGSSGAAENTPAPLGDLKEIVFACRPMSKDPHWYANFGYFAPDANKKAYSIGASLCKLDLETGKVTVLLDDPQGGIRDPQVHYDGKKILFSYRKGGTDPYHLYEIGANGKRLTQLTDSPYDDIEPTYLPDGDIMFCSSRCKRWVNCWLTNVAVLYRCGPDGSRVRQISSNTEHDNTPWPLPDGRVLYQRWEYVDRSQVHYHHLWTANPDGTGQMVYYGNFHPGIVMIDAKPIPGTDKIVAGFSPGHGRRDHDGYVTIVSPKKGPDDQGSARRVSERSDCRDPYPLSEDCFLVAQGRKLVAMNGQGETQVVYELASAMAKKGYHCHEPRPLRARPRERVQAAKSDLTKSTGTLVLSDVYEGRNMAGVKPGEIKKLLILESLPMPIHFHGGMQPISIGGTFTLERVLGTVPVEADGSAHFELPAVRSFFFVALDEHDDSVKRMQSFMSVMPGETQSCVGCHERRTTAPENRNQNALLALKRPPSAIQALKDIPEVFDFPRDIQPILDKHCVKCHDHRSRKAGVVLSGGRGPRYTHSYLTMTSRGLIADGRNKPVSNLAPRAIGSSARRLMKKIDGEHHEVKVTDHERDMIRYWIEAGASYPGTYAAIGSGMIGHAVNPGAGSKAHIETSDQQWPSSKAAAEAVNRRCGSCHGKGLVLPRYLSENRGRGRFSRGYVYDLTQPEKSTILMGPLSKDVGGYGRCRVRNEKGKLAGPATVFKNTEDPDYQKILAMCKDGRKHIEKITRFDMAQFRPIMPYVREMKRFGVLPGDWEMGDLLDPYATDRAYWESMWWKPWSSNAAP